MFELAARTAVARVLRHAMIKVSAACRSKAQRMASENSDKIVAQSGELGYKGFVMSDWGAVHSTVAAANSGLDLEMPGPPTYFGERLSSAVQN